MLEELKTYGSW